MKTFQNISILILVICRNGLCNNSTGNNLQELFTVENLPPWEILNGTTTTVEVSVRISQIRSVLFDVDMSFELHQTWYHPQFVNLSQHSEDFILFKDSDLLLLWRPDTFIANELPNGLYATTETDFAKAFLNGTVFQNTRHSIIFHCNVMLFAIPFKDEICSLYFESASFSQEVLKLKWNEKEPVMYSSEYKNYAVRITNAEAKSCETESVKTSKPCLELKLQLQRLQKVMVIQVFLPSSCIIFITWLGFWIHHTEVSGRTRISVVSFTAIIAESIAVVMMNPEQIHMEAIQLWNTGCIILITGAFLEFVIVHNIHRKRVAEELEESKRKSEESVKESQRATGPSNVDNKQPQRKMNAWTKRNTAKVSPAFIEVSAEEGRVATYSRHAKEKIQPETVDRISAAVFLVLFLAFNIIYWSYLLVPNGA